MTEPLTQKSPLRATPDQMPQTYAPGGTTVDSVQLFVYTSGSPHLMEGQIEGLDLDHRLMEANPSVERMSAEQVVVGKRRRRGTQCAPGLRRMGD